MKFTRGITLLALCASLTIASLPQEAQAIRIKVKQTKGDSNKIVAANSTEADSVQRKKGTLKLPGKKAQLAVLTDEGPLSVVMAYNVDGRVVSARRVLKNPEQFCTEDNIQAYTGLKGRRLNMKIKTREEGDIAFYAGALRNTKKLKKRHLTGLVDVDTDCLPAGNGKTFGAVPIDLGGKILAEGDPLDTDQDADGLLDILDVDVDNDGILNNYDADRNPESFPDFSVFSNLKVDITETLNVNALGTEPTKEQVDALTEKITLAIEVKASGDDESELDCGTLEYCSTGGTGTTGNPESAFPDNFDSDGDGQGTIQIGDTGDFQLKTNLSEFNKLNAGDSFIQTVNINGGGKDFYATSLQFAFKATPAIKSIALDPDGLNFVQSFTYPVSEGDVGTSTNCWERAPHDGDQFLLEFVAWRPQRAGVAALGEDDFMDLGNSLITIDIPNKPSVGNTSTEAGPGICPMSSYSTSDPNLTITADGLQDSFGDRAVDAANLVTFRVNITDCLASVGQTLAFGESITIDLQFRNAVGDNAAQKICFEHFT